MDKTSILAGTGMGLGFAPRSPSVTWLVPRHLPSSMKVAIVIQLEARQRAAWGMVPVGSGLFDAALLQTSASALWDYLAVPQTFFQTQPHALHSQMVVFAPAVQTTRV